MSGLDIVTLNVLECPFFNHTCDMSWLSIVCIDNNYFLYCDSKVNTLPEFYLNY